MIWCILILLQVLNSSTKGISCKNQHTAPILALKAHICSHFYARYLGNWAGGQPGDWTSLGFEPQGNSSRVRGHIVLLPSKWFLRSSIFGSMTFLYVMEVFMSWKSLCHWKIWALLQLPISCHCNLTWQSEHKNTSWFSHPPYSLTCQLHVHSYNKSSIYHGLLLIWP